MHPGITNASSPLHRTRRFRYVGHDSGNWGTIPFQLKKCPASHRNPAPHQTESCPASRGFTAPLRPESAAGAKLYPTGELDASATAERQSLQGNLGSIAGGYPTFRRNIHEYAIGPAASWELDVAGGLRHNAAAFRDEVQAAEAERSGTRVMIAADAADAYLQVRGYQARLAIAKNQIETDEHLLKLIQNR